MPLSGPASWADFGAALAPLAASASGFCPCLLSDPVAQRRALTECSTGRAGRLPCNPAFPANPSAMVSYSVPVRPALTDDTRGSNREVINPLISGGPKLSIRRRGGLPTLGGPLTAAPVQS